MTGSSAREAPDALYTATIEVTDPDAGDTKTFALTAASPAWITINADTGVLTGTPINEDVGENIPVSVIVTDFGGLTADTTYTIKVLNVNNGARLSTYAIEGEQGEICLNGPAARQAVKGDLVIILTYSYIDEQDVRSHSPKMIHVNEKNAITEIKRGMVFKPSEYFN